jgi:hypothetical protein
VQFEIQQDVASVIPWESNKTTELTNGGKVCKNFGKCVVTGGKENLVERNLSMFTHLLSCGLERFLREILFVTLSYIWMCGILIPTIMTF